MSKKMTNMLSLDFEPHLSRPLRSFPCVVYVFLLEHLYNQCQDLCRTFSEILTIFDAVPL
jgi:hypothetical protein